MGWGTKKKLNRREKDKVQINLGITQGNNIQRSRKNV